MRKLASGALGVRACCLVLCVALFCGSSLGVAPSAWAAEPSPAADVRDPGGVPPGAVEVVSSRTGTAKHYRLPDGRMLALVSSAPVHYQDAGGAWREIDTSLVPDVVTGRLQAASSASPASFGRERSGSSPAEVGIGGRTIGIDLLGAAERSPVPVGPRAHFTGVLAGTDLVYEATADGIKESLVLRSPAAPATFAFAVRTDGLSLAGDAREGWRLVDPRSGAPVAALGALTVFDSSKNAAGDPAYCGGATMEAAAVGEVVVVSYSLPREWLDDPARVYPVVVDPSITPVASRDTFVSSKYTTTPYGGSTELKCGYYDATTGQNRTLVHFDLSSVPSISRVDAATFSIYQFHTYYTNTATSTYLAKATGAWSDATTWTNKPGYALIASQSLAGRGVWVNWSQTAVVSAVQGWVSSPSSANHGFMCYQDEGGSQNTTHWRKFYSKEHGTSSLRPKIAVTYTVAPDPVTSVSAQTTASGWFREVDRNGDGISDTPNDLRDVGRGAVSLTWSPVARAAGYKVMMYDGDSYEQVGRVSGNATTTWSSAGSGIFPADSEIAGWGVGARNALTRAATPRAATKVSSLSVPDVGGAGVVVTDGTYLYVRAWSTYPGPTAWKKVGTGLAGTVAGYDHGTVGPDLDTQRILSAFYLDGIIYDGFAAAPNAVHGVPKGAGPGDEALATLTFTGVGGAPVPLLARDTAQAVSAGSSALLVASDGERIYNVCYTLAGGALYDGYTIRVFDRTGRHIEDRTIPTTSAYIDGVLADGDALYLIEWTATDAATVTKVRLSDFTVANQWTIDQGVTKAVNGCVDPATGSVWLGRLEGGGTVYRYLGPGLGLRDDPEALYEKSTTTAYLDNHNYWFRVVPFNSYGEASLGDCLPAMPTLDNRTVGVNDLDRDTTYEVAEFAGHTLTAVLDEAALEAEVTDLSVASWGPEAAVSRRYSSDDTAVHMLANAPGWRFDFERSIVATSGGAAFTDGTGEVHRFVFTGGAYHAPNGSYDALTLSGGQYTLMHKDRTREVFDAATGRLLAVIDKHGNTTSYAWAVDSLIISAANGQSIQVVLSAGKVASAAYVTAAGTRTVTYATAGAPTVTHFAGDAACEYAVEYGYASGQLASVTVPDYPEGGTDAQWAFLYSGGALAEARTAAYADDPHARTTISYGANQATVTSCGDVTDTSTWSVTEDAAIETHCTWNPTGTMATMTDSHVAGAAHASWTYTYSPTNEAVKEVSPTGRNVSRVLDSRGNMTATFDEEGHRTTYVYDALGQLLRETDARGCTTYRTYGTGCFGGTGDVESEERQLTTTARSRAEYDHDSAGRMTEKRERIGSEEWAITEYGDFGPSGEPGWTSQVGVRLEEGAWPRQLTTTRSYDGFGDVTHETDATGVWVAANAYDIAGSLRWSRDARGAYTWRTYDKLGNETATWREAGNVVTDRVEKTYDVSGRLRTEAYLLSVSPRTVDRSVGHAYDASGRETGSDDSRVTGERRTRHDARGNAVQSWTEGSDLALAKASTRSIYDVYGQLVRELAPGAETAASTYAYLPSGLTSQVTNPDGSWTSYTYDDGGLRLTETVPTEDGEATSTFTYDIGARLVASTNAEGATTTNAYDLLDRQVSASADGQPASTTVYNTAGWVLRATDADGIAKTKAYEEAGRVVVETEAGTTTSWNYNLLGRPVERTDPDGTVVTTEYDPFDRAVLESQESSAGAPIKTTETEYDTISRVTRTTVVDHRAGTTRTTETTYPTGGAPETVVTVERAGADTVITYDAAGRETNRESSTAAGALVRTVEEGGFDAANRAVAWSFRGVASSRAFDGAGRVASQDGEGFGTGGARYGYDASSGRKTAETLDVAYPGADETNAYAYTESGRLASATVAGATTAYAHDPATGNLQRIARPGGTAALSYDTGNRLARMTGPASTTVFGWDAARGWRTSQGPPADPDLRRFAYTEAGRLSRFEDDGSGTVATYAYDAYGQRTSSVVTENTAATTTRYTYEGLTLLRLDASRVEGSTTATWSVTYLTDSESRPYAGVYESGTTRLALGIVTTDRGDVRELTNSAGVPFAFYGHDAYGNPTTTLARAVTGIAANLAAAIAERNILRYAGYAYDAHSGLYYCSLRYYDPQTASFITKDPAKADGEESPYQYCGGDPVGKTDPSGLRADWTNAHGGDATRAFWSLLRVHANRAAGWYRAVRSNWTLKSLWFVWHVREGGPWDLKLQLPWKRLRIWVVDGERYSPADLGNIHYGYVGKALGYTDWELTRAGGITHVLKNREDYLPAMSWFARYGLKMSPIQAAIAAVGRFEPRLDKTMILRGISWYWGR